MTQTSEQISEQVQIIKRYEAGNATREEAAHAADRLLSLVMVYLIELHEDLTQRQLIAQLEYSLKCVRQEQGFIAAARERYWAGIRALRELEDD